MSLLIVLRVVRSQGGPREEEMEVVETSEEKENLARTSWELLVGMFRTVVKRRPGWLRSCILLQLAAYTSKKRTFII